MAERRVLLEQQAVRVVETHLQFSCKLVITARWNFVVVVIIIIILYYYYYLLTAVELSPGGSGYFTCIQNMKLFNKI